MNAPQPKIVSRRRGAASPRTGAPARVRPRRSRAPSGVKRAESGTILVIYNPAAGRRRRQRFQRTLRAIARTGYHVAVRETTVPGEAQIFAREAVGRGFTAIVVAGGDGTINEVAGSLAGSKEVLGIIPLGTANVLAAEIGVPTRPERIARIIAAGNHKRIRIGEISNHRFVMMAGVGFDARTVVRVTPGLKRLTGKLAYVIAALSELIHYKPVRLRLTLDGTEMTAASAVIANGHYYAGRFVLAPKARLEQAALYVCLFERAGRWNLLRYTLAMALGWIGRLPDVRIVRAKSGVIFGAENEPVQADGDVIGQTPIAFALLPESLTMLVP